MMKKCFTIITITGGDGLCMTIAAVVLPTDEKPKF